MHYSDRGRTGKKVDSCTMYRLKTEQIGWFNQDRAHPPGQVTLVTYAINKGTRLLIVGTYGGTYGEGVRSVMVETTGHMSAGKDKPFVGYVRRLAIVSPHVATSVGCAEASTRPLCVNSIPYKNLFAGIAENASKRGELCTMLLQHAKGLLLQKTKFSPPAECT